MRVDKNITRTNVAAAQRRPPGAASAYVCDLCSTEIMRRLPNDATGREIAGCLASAAVARICRVDLFWFLAHAMFSFARGNCGLSWPTTYYCLVRNPKNQTQ